MTNLNRVSAYAVGVAVLAFGGTIACGKSPSGPTKSAFAVTSVAPNTGTFDAETFVRVFGSGFESGATLTVDGVATPAAWLSSSSLSATLPKHAVGRVDLVVTNPGGQTSRLTGGFQYVVPPPPPPPTAINLVITGNLALAAVGDTSQLTATAGYPDGSTADVTEKALWASLSLPNITVSPTGLLTAQALGLGTIQVRYLQSAPALSLTRYLQISVSPAGTFVVSGRIREPGEGGVPGALVRHTASGQSVLTSTDGDFSFPGVTNTHLAVTKDGYEPIELDAKPNEYADPPLQRIVRSEAGASVSQILAPNDMDYLTGSGAHCQPCRLVRITSITAGTLHVRVTWTAANVQMNIWANGQVFSGSASTREAVADVPVGAGEQILYVGRSSGSAMLQSHTAFTISTSAPGAPAAALGGDSQTAAPHLALEPGLRQPPVAHDGVR